MAATPLPSPKVNKYVGDNGVTILQQNNLTSRAFCMGVWIDHGSRDERAGEEGLSHFLEHMIFKGTRTRSSYELSQAIEKVGGALEAFTTKEQICVYAQVLDDHKVLASEVMSDMILNSTFADAHIEPERQVVLEEISDVLDAPDDLIHDLFASEIFPGHPFGKPILGTPESVSNFRREQLRSYSRRLFRGGNIVVSIVGSCDRRTLFKLCEWAFSLPPGRSSSVRKRFGRYQAVRRVFRRKLHHQHICIGGRSYSYLDDKRYPLMLLTTLLGGAMSSRLFQRIREQLGYTYSIYTYSDPARDTGLIGTYMSVKPQNTRRVVDEVFREFRKIRDGDISASELEDTREHLKGRILLGLETSTQRMVRMARNEMYFGRQVSERELIDNIDRVTMDDVMDVAHDALDRDRNTIVSLGPSTSGMSASL